jgi:hypothetical protein
MSVLMQASVNSNDYMHRLFSINTWLSCNVGRQISSKKVRAQWLGSPLDNDDFLEWRQVQTAMHRFRGGPTPWEHETYDTIFHYVGEGWEAYCGLSHRIDNQASFDFFVRVNNDTQALKTKLALFTD